MTTTRWRLQSEGGAAAWVNITVKKLREMRIHGGGPVWLTLPCGDIKYRVEDLDDWACSGGDVLHVEADSNVVTFPGSRVRVRLMLPQETPPRPGKLEAWVRARREQEDES